MNIPRRFLVALAACAVVSTCFAQATLSSPSIAMARQPGSQTLVDKLNQALNLTDEQRHNLDPIIAKYEDRIASIKADSTLSSDDRQTALRSEADQLKTELQPSLTADQMARLERFLAPRKRFVYHPSLTVDYDEFFPTDAYARSIFGRAPSGFGVSPFDTRSDSDSRERIGYGLSAVDITGSNTITVVSPQVTYRFNYPLRKDFVADIEAGAGPAYMDYSYDTPAGAHYGAKRLGAVGTLEAGLRYGPVKFAVGYYVSTEPTGVNLNGFTATIKWTIFRM